MQLAQGCGCTFHTCSYRGHPLLSHLISRRRKHCLGLILGLLLLTRFPSHHNTSINTKGEKKKTAEKKKQQKSVLRHLFLELIVNKTKG